MMTCIFSPIDCIYNVTTDALAAVPWFWFLGGIVLGALIGRYFGAIVVVGALLLLARRPKPVSSSDIWKHPDDPPPKRSRPTIFRGRK